MIKLHSITSIITNSSTVIYTYSDASGEAAKNMINEILKTLGVEGKTFDDFFTTVLLFRDSHLYYEYLENNTVEGIDENSDIGSLYEDVMAGILPKPTWFEEAEAKSENSENGYSYPTTLYLVPKKPEYANMANLIKKFLYSTSHEAFRDG